MRNPIFWLKKEFGIRKAHSWARKGKTEQALEHLSALSEASPKDVDLRIQQALCMADLKRFDQALEVTESALKTQPNHGVLHLIRGEILYSLKQFESAKEALLKALDLSGDNIRAEYSLGLVYIALGDVDKAAQYFESSVRYDRTLVQSRLLAMAEIFLFHESERKSSVS